MTGESSLFEVERVGQLSCVRLLSGALAIGHRPPLRALEKMRQAKITHIVSVLSERENPCAIAAAASDAGLEWFWIELGSTKILPARAKPELVQAVRALTSILSAGGRIYLHCSAGIHRTGMIAAALLFHLGYSESDVVDGVAALRQITASEMGTDRLNWARSFAPS